MSMNRTILAACCFIAIFGLTELHAQRIYTRGSDIVLEDAQGHVTSLGPGFNPIPVSDRQFLLIRGAQMGYGDIGCDRGGAKDRVVIFDATTNKESVLYDRPIRLPFAGAGSVCVYEHADLSPSGRTLYIVIPCYVTADCLAVIDLASGKVKYVRGADDVFVIRGGPNAGDLLYMAFLAREPTEDDPRVGDYAYVHARPDGSRIAVISHEALVLGGGNAPAPKLRAWLRSIHGRIFAQGEWIP